MSTIKDMVDLVTQLSNKIKDRGFISEAREILKMAGDIQAEHVAIHEKNIQLMEENAKLRQDIATLKKQEEQAEDKERESEKIISKEQEKILLFLTEAERVTAERIACQLQYDITKVEYWLECLRDNDMISRSIVINQPSTYSLAQAGREYLFKNELI